MAAQEEAPGPEMVEADETEPPDESMDDAAGAEASEAARTEAEGSELEPDDVEDEPSCPKALGHAAAEEELPALEAAVEEEELSAGHHGQPPMLSQHGPNSCETESQADPFAQGGAMLPMPPPPPPPHPANAPDADSDLPPASAGTVALRAGPCMLRRSPETIARPTYGWHSAASGRSSAADQGALPATTCARDGWRQRAHATTPALATRAAPGSSSLTTTRTRVLPWQAQKKPTCPPGMKRCHGCLQMLGIRCKVCPHCKLQIPARK